MRRNLSVVKSRGTCVRLTRLEIGMHNLLYAAHALYVIFLFVRFGETIHPVTVSSIQHFRIISIDREDRQAMLRARSTGAFYFCDDNQVASMNPR